MQMHTYNVRHLNISGSRAAEWVTANTVLPFIFHIPIQAKTRVKVMTFEFFILLIFIKKKKKAPKNWFPSHIKLQLFPTYKMMARISFCSLLLNSLAPREERKKGVFLFSSNRGDCYKEVADHVQPKPRTSPKHANIPTSWKLDCTRGNFSNPQWTASVIKEWEGISYATSALHIWMQLLLA